MITFIQNWGQRAVFSNQSKFHSFIKFVYCSGHFNFQKKENTSLKNIIIYIKRFVLYVQMKSFDNCLKIVGKIYSNSSLPAYQLSLYTPISEGNCGMSVHWLLTIAGWAFNPVVYAHPRKAPARFHIQHLKDTTRRSPKGIPLAFYH